MGVTIDGKTRLAGVVGSPLEHTLSPAIHNAAYPLMRLNWVYLPLPVQRSADLHALTAAVRVLPFVGFNVTMPYKQAMLDLCDEVATTASMAGSVNAVQCLEGRLIGYNTDGRGLLDCLAAEAGFEPQGKRVVVVGAGGAAGGAVVGLILGKAASIMIANRDLGRAAALLERVSRHLRGTQVDAVVLGPNAEGSVREADLVVNATPLGWSPDDPSPVPLDWLREGQVVADMVYGRETPLLRAAAARRAKAVGGLGMLVNQAALAIEIWNGESQAVAPRDVMRRIAEEVLSPNGEAPVS